MLPLMRKRHAWRVIDGVIAGVMFVLAAGMLFAGRRLAIKQAEQLMRRDGHCRRNAVRETEYAGERKPDCRRRGRSPVGASQIDIWRRCTRRKVITWSAARACVVDTRYFWALSQSKPHVNAAAHTCIGCVAARFYHGAGYAEIKRLIR